VIVFVTQIRAGFAVVRELGIGGHENFLLLVGGRDPLSHTHQILQVGVGYCLVYLGSQCLSRCFVTIWQARVQLDVGDSVGNDDPFIECDQAIIPQFLCQVVYFLCHFVLLPVWVKAQGVHIFWMLDNPLQLLLTLPTHFVSASLVGLLLCIAERISRSSHLLCVVHF